MALEGRTALVTGAGGDGIGRAIALALARDGADVALNWHRKRDGAERTAGAIEAIGRRALLIDADVADATSVDALVRTAAEQLGQVDILINNAGGPWKPQDVTEIEPGAPAASPGDGDRGDVLPAAGGAAGHAGARLGPRDQHRRARRRRLALRPA